MNRVTGHPPANCDRLDHATDSTQFHLSLPQTVKVIPEPYHTRPTVQQLHSLSTGDPVCSAEFLFSSLSSS